MAKPLQILSYLSNIIYRNGVRRKFSSLKVPQISGPSKISRKTWNFNGAGRSLLCNCIKPLPIIPKRYLNRDALAAKIHASSYIIMRAAPTDFDDMLDVMWQCYFPDEPCVRSLGLGRERNAVFDEQMLDVMKKGLSIVARCKYNGVIVGGAINNSTNPWDPDLTERHACTLADPDMRELYLFWAYVQRAPNIWKKYCTNKIFEVQDVFVSHDERGRGLGRILTDFSLQHGADSGFRLLRVDATSTYEQKICENLGMRMEYDIPFCSYVGANNEPVISPSPPHDRGIRVYVIEPHSLPKRR